MTKFLLDLCTSAIGGTLCWLCAVYACIGVDERYISFLKRAGFVMPTDSWDDIRKPTDPEARTNLVIWLAMIIIIYVARVI